MDGGPPFNGHEFRDFAKQEGFNHHVVTPDHPRANGEAERFMQTLNKIERIAHRETTDKFARRIAIENMLIAYRETPHPATGISPYQAIRNREIRTKLDYINQNKMKSEEDKKMEDRDASYKMKNKLRRENRNTKEHNFITGDYVLVEQPKKNKWTTPYEPAFYVVVRIQGSTITARHITDGREITRDGSRFKLANGIMQQHNHSTTSIHDNTSTEEDWRESCYATQLHSK